MGENGNARMRDKAVRLSSPTHTAFQIFVTEIALNESHVKKHTMTVSYRQVKTKENKVVKDIKLMHT